VRSHEGRNDEHRGGLAQFCSMKPTKQVREFAKKGMEEKNAVKWMPRLERHRWFR
jgi:hypothetical protein